MPKRRERYANVNANIQRPWSMILTETKLGLDLTFSGNLFKKSL